MKKMIFGGIAVLVFAAVAALNLDFNSKRLISLSLEGIEALAQEIDYSVPAKNNKPEACYFWVDASGNIYYNENGAGAGVSLKKDSGMQNFCESPKSGEKATGCDPYNCHKRV